MRKYQNDKDKTMEKQWISVEERLPEYGNYLVCLKNKAVMDMTFSPFGSPRWFKVGVGDAHSDNPVTHWMPLPEPPTT